MIWDFSIIQQNHALACPDLYMLICQSSYYTSLISPEQGIDETVNFRNFGKLLGSIFCGILAPKQEKQNESDRAHEAWCNGYHLYIALGK